MAKRFTQLVQLSAPADDDIIAIVDMSTGVTKYIRRDDFFGGLVPSGVISDFGGSVTPDGWLLCDGSEVSRSTYANLFSAIGTTWGIGDGSTTFNLPNLKGKGRIMRDASQSEFDSLAETGGAKTHTLTTNEMPSHTHNQNAHNHTTDAGGAHNHTIGTLGTSGSYGIKDGAASSSGTGSTSSHGGHTHGVNNATATNQNTGGGAAHNNLGPYAVVNSIIKI